MDRRQPAPPCLTLPTRRTMSELSQASFYQAISEGVSPSMPAFGEQLSEDERWAVSAYLRWLTFSPSGQPVADEPGLNPGCNSGGRTSCHRPAHGSHQ